MPVRQSPTKTEEVHQHYFVQGYNQDERYCKCGALKISLEEYQRRIDEWDNYFSLVKTTDSYQDYMKIKKLGWEKDNPEKVELMKRIKQRLEKNDYLSKPGFPDPTTWSKYVTE